MHIPFVSTYLDRTSMYQVVLEGLVALYGVAIVASFIGAVGFTPTELILTGLVVIGGSMLMSYLCAVVMKAPAQHLSSLITALILVLLLLPSALPYDLFTYAAIGAIAVASKYVLVWRKQHVFNPVAAGVVIGSLAGFSGASWWVANPILFIPLILIGLLVVLKVRRVEMVMSFIAVAFIGYIVSEWGSQLSSTELITTFFLSYPFIFLACFMLTEPFTMPGTKQAQVYYGIFVAIVASLPPLGSFVVSPELALVIGNVVFFSQSVRQKLILTLVSVRELTPRIYEFSFKKPAGMTFVAGQYLEWMLPHTNADNRGVRRYFTIASAPEDTMLQVALKVPEKASTFKQALVNLPSGGQVIASQRAGDFILPLDESVKLGWIAGGIGVTPFVSQSRHLLKSVSTRDIVALYATQTAADTAYLDVLTQVAEVVSVVGTGEPLPGGETGYVTAELIKRRVPDYSDRVWYVSGPPMMVNAATSALRTLKVPASQIKEDFFPGLA